MNCIIVNKASTVVSDFILDVRRLEAAGYVITPGYIQRLDDTEKPYPGSWGFLQFASALPAEELFPAPDVEYRRNEQDGLWVCSAGTLVNQGFIEGLFNYFTDPQRIRP